MKIAIQGQDYTPTLDAAHPLTIERKLNEPSVCRLWLSLPTPTNPQVPTRNQSLAILGDDATVYFTGYLAVTPLPEYAGMALEGPRYCIALQAISDELLLDQLLMPPGTSPIGDTAAALMTALVAHSGSQALSTSGVTLATPVNNFVPDQGANWSASAAQAASQARATYRAQAERSLSPQCLPRYIPSTKPTVRSTLPISPSTPASSALSPTTSPSA